MMTGMAMAAYGSGDGSDGGTKTRKHRREEEESKEWPLTLDLHE